MELLGRGGIGCWRVVRCEGNNPYYWTGLWWQRRELSMAQDAQQYSEALEIGEGIGQHRYSMLYRKALNRTPRGTKSAKAIHRC